MSTRKSKDSPPSLIELPSERLQLITVEVKPSKTLGYPRVRNAGEALVPEYLPIARRRLH